jgi:hypothetical protein
MCGENLPCSTGSDCRHGQCISQDPTGTICEFDGNCVAGHACIEGRCSFVRCVPEACDGIDNDCNGVVDDSATGPLSEFCYSGADITRVFPPCQTGVRVCTGGEWSECLGEVPPTAELGLLGCDGEDNDCDGCVDGVWEADRCVAAEPAEFDVVFFIDSSGSMSSSIEVVKTAVRVFSTSLSTSPQFHWGIVRIPDQRTDSINELYFDLGAFSDFEVALNSMETSRGSDEPQWDAIYEAVTGELGLTWRPAAARILILFTDEEGQTTRALRGLSSTSEAVMCGALTSGEVLVVATTPAYRSDFDECPHSLFDLPTGTGGWLTSCRADADCIEEDVCRSSLCISEEAAALADDLAGVITDPCR